MLTPELASAEILHFIAEKGDNPVSLSDLKSHLKLPAPFINRQVKDLLSKKIPLIEKTKEGGFIFVGEDLLLPKRPDINIQKQSESVDSKKDEKPKKKRGRPPKKKLETSSEITEIGKIDKPDPVEIQPPSNKVEKNEIVSLRSDFLEEEIENNELIKPSEIKKASKSILKILSEGSLSSSNIYSQLNLGDLVIDAALKELIDEDQIDHMELELEDDVVYYLKDSTEFKKVDNKSIVDFDDIDDAIISILKNSKCAQLDLTNRLVEENSLNRFNVFKKIASRLHDGYIVNANGYLSIIDSYQRPTIVKESLDEKEDNIKDEKEPEKERTFVTEKDSSVDEEFLMALSDLYNIFEIDVDKTTALQANNINDLKDNVIRIVNENAQNERKISQILDIVG